jgi:hypothetical protein
VEKCRPVSGSRSAEPGPLRLFQPSAPAGRGVERTRDRRRHARPPDRRRLSAAGKWRIGHLHQPIRDRQRLKLDGIEPPLSGPGPVVNKARRRQTFDVDGRPSPAANAPLVSEATQLVGDYTNPILKPEAAEIVKMHAEMSLAGVGYPSPRASPSFSRTMPCNCCSGPTRLRCFMTRIMRSDVCA